MADAFCVVVKDRFGDTHADTFDPETETAPDEAHALVERLGLDDTDGETFKWAVLPYADPGAARLVRSWRCAVESGSFTVECADEGAGADE